jgi:hypothetical protein
MRVMPRNPEDGIYFALTASKFMSNLEPGSLHWGRRSQQIAVVVEGILGKERWG